MIQLLKNLSEEKIKSIKKNPYCITILIGNFELEKISEIIKKDNFNGEKFFRFFDEFFKEEKDFQIFEKLLKSKNFDGIILNKLIDFIFRENYDEDVSGLKFLIVKISSDDDGYALENFLVFLSKIFEHRDNKAIKEFFFLLCCCEGKHENLANLFKNKNFKDFIENFIHLFKNEDTEKLAEEFKKEDFNEQEFIENYLSHKEDDK